MHQGAERHPITPAGGEVLNVNVLRRNREQESVDQCTCVTVVVVVVVGGFLSTSRPWRTGQRAVKAKRFAELKEDGS